MRNKIVSLQIESAPKQPVFGAEAHSGFSEAHRLDEEYGVANYVLDELKASIKVLSNTEPGSVKHSKALSSVRDLGSEMYLLVALAQLFEIRDGVHGETEASTFEFKNRFVVKSIGTSSIPDVLIGLVEKPEKGQYFEMLECLGFSKEDVNFESLYTNFSTFLDRRKAECKPEKVDMDLMCYEFSSLAREIIHKLKNVYEERQARTQKLDSSPSTKGLRVNYTRFDLLSNVDTSDDADEVSAHRVFMHLQPQFEKREVAAKKTGIYSWVMFKINESGAAFNIDESGVVDAEPVDRVIQRVCSDLSRHVDTGTSAWSQEHVLDVLNYLKGNEDTRTKLDTIQTASNREAYESRIKSHLKLSPLETEYIDTLDDSFKKMDALLGHGGGQVYISDTVWSDIRLASPDKIELLASEKPPEQFTVDGILPVEDTRASLSSTVMHNQRRSMDMADTVQRFGAEPFSSVFKHFDDVEDTKCLTRFFDGSVSQHNVDLHLERSMHAYNDAKGLEKGEVKTETRFYPLTLDEFRIVLMQNETVVTKPSIEPNTATYGQRVSNADYLALNEYYQAIRAACTTHEYSGPVAYVPIASLIYVRHDMKPLTLPRLDSKGLDQVDMAQHKKEVKEKTRQLVGSFVPPRRMRSNSESDGEAGFNSEGRYVHPHPPKSNRPSSSIREVHNGENELTSLLNIKPFGPAFSGRPPSNVRRKFPGRTYVDYFNDFQKGHRSIGTAPSLTGNKIVSQQV